MVFDDQILNVPPSKNPRYATVAIDAAVSPLDADGIDLLLEDILVWAEKVHGANVLIQAKEDFFQKYGKIFPEDDFFNVRMQYFTDFFIFDWRIKGPTNENSLTPFASYHQDRSTHSEHSRIFANVRHSLFRVTKLSTDGLQLEDCLTDNKIKVSSRFKNNFFAIKKNDIFQGYLYVLNNMNILSHGVVFHPTVAYKIIKSFLKKAKKSQSLNETDILHLLARTQLRQKRHPHVNPKLIYNQIIT